MKIVGEETKISNNVADKIKYKKYLLHFLPEPLKKCRNAKIKYNEMYLKGDYIIDLISSMLLKYYFRKDNTFPLNASLLKEKYGYLYNYYIKYLIDNNYISLLKEYRVGVRCRSYRLTDKILKSDISRYQNRDKVLLRKYKNRLLSTEHLSLDNIDFIDIDIKEKLVNDLYDVKINIPSSEAFLNSVLMDKDIYHRNMYTVHAIDKKHIFYHFDNFGRMHTNFTILKSTIRKNYITIDDEKTCEIDIPNSQPLFLTKLIRDTKTKWVKKEEYDKFRYLTVNGLFYDYLMNELNIKNRKDVKKLTYRVLFGRNGGNNNADKQFKKLFPSIHHYIKLYKKEHKDYKRLSHTLQRMESELVFNTIIRKIMLLYPDIKIITVHDSIIVPKKHEEKVSSIFYLELENEFGREINKMNNVFDI